MNPSRLWILVAAVLIAAPFRSEPAETSAPDYPSERSLQLLFYAATGGGHHKYPRNQELANNNLAYAAIGMLLMRLEQVEIVLEYGGPSPEKYKSLLLSLGKKEPPSSRWLTKQVTAEALVKMLTVLAQEGHFIGMNHAKNAIPPGPHYKVLVRTTDDAVEHYRTLDVVPGAHDDKKTGLPRPETVRVFQYLQAAAVPAADAFDQVLAPLLPLKFTLQLENDKIPLGKPVWLKLEMQAVGNTPISVCGMGGFDPRYPNCDILDSKGHRVEYDRRANLQRRVATPADFFTLKPQETRQFRIDLNQGLMKPLAPDTYRVTCTYYGQDQLYNPKTNTMRVQYPWKGILKSNSLDFVVQ